jgi:hypothetical protein
MKRNKLEIDSSPAFKGQKESEPVIKPFIETGASFLSPTS